MPRTKNFNENEAIEKALQLFWNNGFHATSMQELVDELKINRASIYSTFHNKQNLFLLAIELYSRKYLKWWGDTLYYETIVRSGVIKLLEKEGNLKLSNGQSSPCFILKTTLEMYGKDEKITNLIENHRSMQVEMLLNYLKYGVSQGQISPYKEIYSLADLLLDVINGVSLSSKCRKEKDYIKKQTSNILNLLN